MKSAIFALVLVSHLSSALGGLLDGKRTRDYVQKLAANSYDKTIPPVGSEGPGTPVKVTVSAFILDIHTIDSSKMEFSANFYFRQSWTDPRLKHDIDVDEVKLNNVDNIWTPDLFFVEEREGSIHQVSIPNMFCRIKPNGQVLFSSKYGVTFNCPMNLQNFPHDIQRCKVNVESYGFQRNHIDLEWFDGHHKPLMYAENLTTLEFDLIDVTPSLRYATMPTGNYSCLQMNLTFKRKFGFFAIRLYVPFIILVLMSSLSFWIKAEERCLRMALLLVIFCLMVAISTSINNLMPSAPYTKASDVWIGFCESLVFAAFFEFLVAALLARKEAEEDAVKNKGEILSLDPEDKENKLASPLSKVLNMFNARQGGSKTSLSLRIDKICRVVYFIIFIIFNIVYWTIYCS